MKILEKIHSILGIMVAISFPFMIIYFTFTTSFDKYCISTSSISEIKKLNEEIITLTILEGEKYDTKDDLIFDILGIVDNKIFKKYSNFFIENLIIDDQDNSHKYIISNIHELIVTEHVISRLNSIENIKYNSEILLLYNIKKNIGEVDYNKYKNIFKITKDKNNRLDSIIINISGYAFLFSLIGSIIVFIIKKLKIRSTNIKKNDITLEKFLNKSLSEPNRITPRWDYAKEKLNMYYERNLKQMDSIFLISLLSMITGFILIVLMIIIALFNNAESDVTKYGILAGIITEFIGATFLFMYKSIIAQAIKYTKNLEEADKVGMSISIVDSIEVNDHESNYNKEIIDAKLSIAKLLLNKEDD